MNANLISIAARRRAYRNRSIVTNAYAAWVVRKQFPIPTQTVAQLLKELNDIA